MRQATSVTKTSVDRDDPNQPKVAPPIRLEPFKIEPRYTAGWKTRSASVDLFTEHRGNQITAIVVMRSIRQRFAAGQTRFAEIIAKHIGDFNRVRHGLDGFGIHLAELIDVADDLRELAGNCFELGIAEAQPRQECHLFNVGTRDTHGNCNWPARGQQLIRVRDDSRIQSHRAPAEGRLLFGFSFGYDLGRVVGNLERSGPNDLCDRTAAEALRADQHCLMCAVGRRNFHALQIRLELPPTNAGDFRANAAQVLLLTTDGNRIAELSAFTANTALPSHRTTSCQQNVVSNIESFGKP